MAIHYDSSVSAQYTDINDTALRDRSSGTWGVCFRVTEAPHSTIPRVINCQESGSNNGWSLAVHDGGIWAPVDLRVLQNWSGTNLEIRAEISLTNDQWVWVFWTSNGTSAAPQMWIADGINASLVEATYNAQSTPTGSVTSTTAAGVRLAQFHGASPGDSTGFRGDIAAFAMWSDVKTEAQLKALRWMPFSKWRDPNSLCSIWTPKPGAGVNFGHSTQPSDTGSPTQADSPPIIAPFTAGWSAVPYAVAGNDVTVNATTDALTLTEQAAAVAIDVTVNAGVDALTLTENAATISYDVTVSAATDALTVTENAATISYDVTVSATTDALALTENAASVSLGVDVAAATDALTLTSFSASVIADTLVNATTATLTLTENAASVAYDVTVSAATDALAVTENAASIAYDVTVAASTDALALTTLAATVQGGIGAVTLFPPHIATAPARTTTVTAPARVTAATAPARQTKRAYFDDGFTNGFDEGFN